MFKRGRNRSSLYSVRIHISNDYDAFDDKVYVDVKLSVIPRMGEIIHISPDLRKMLERKVKSSLAIANRYAPKWAFYEPMYCNEFTKDNLKDINLEDAKIVELVAYSVDSDIIHIELGS